MEKKYQILIVEDEKMLLEMYKDRFEQEGFEVITAKDGEKGLKMALEKRPDLLVLDILLPKKEGTDVLKEVRESGDWGKTVPIVMLTNLDSKDYILEAVERYQPSYYFLKVNTELNDMVEKIKQLMS